MIYYRVDSAGGDFRVLAGGVATTPTSVSCNKVVPVTGQIAFSQMTNNTNVGFRILESLGTYGASGRIYGIVANSFVTGPIVLNAAQEFIYYVTGAPTGSVLVDVAGYQYTR